MDPIILHADLNAFYASVELLDRPDLRSVPMAVAGDAEQRHGIILAKNELAKAYGVKTAETIWQARRKCPQLVLVPPRHDQYALFSKRARAVFERLTDRVEPFGVDEAWLDVTGSTGLFGDGARIADLLREMMRRELGLTCSVGVSFTKAFAKIGSDLRKPDATTVIGRADYRRMIWPLPVQNLLFVGSTTASRLARIGIRTIGDLARCPPEVLGGLLGRNGEELHRMANGTSDADVATAADRADRKSISASTTLPRDLHREEDVKPVLYRLSDEVAGRLRAAGMLAGTAQIQVLDNTFSAIDRQSPLHPPSDLGSELAEASLKLFRRHYRWQNPIRLLGVKAGNLIPADGSRQLEIGDLAAAAPQRPREKELERAIDQIRERFGDDAIGRGIHKQD